MVEVLEAMTIGHGNELPEPELGPYHPAHPGLEALTFGAAVLLVAAATRFVFNKLTHHQGDHAE